MVDVQHTEEVAAMGSLLPDGAKCMLAVEFLQWAAHNARLAMRTEGHASFARHSRAVVFNLERAAEELGFDLVPRAEGKDARAP